MCSRKWLFLSLCRCDFVLHSILFKHSVHFLSNKPKTEFKAYILIGYLIFLENGSQTEGNLEELNKLREKETVIEKERPELWSYLHIWGETERMAVGSCLQIQVTWTEMQLRRNTCLLIFLHMWDELEATCLNLGITC